MKHLHNIIYPEPELENYIEHFWSVNERHKDLEERVMPIGTLELLYIEKPYRQITETGDAREIKGWVLMGQRTKVMGIRSIDSIKVFGLRFKPWGLYNFINIPLHEFKDDIISLSETSPALAKELDNAVEAIAGYGERCRNVQKVLLKRLSSNAALRMPLILHTLRVIKVSNNFSVLEYAERAGISHKNLNKAFKNYTGLTIKEYHKIYRLQKALNVLAPGVIPNWAELAASCGFYDQAHFIKDLKAFTGFTPIEYLLNRNEKFFNVSSKSKEVNFLQYPHKNIA